MHSRWGRRYCRKDHQLIPFWWCTAWHLIAHSWRYWWHAHCRSESWRRKDACGNWRETAICRWRGWSSIITGQWRFGLKAVLLRRVTWNEIRVVSMFRKENHCAHTLVKRWEPTMEIQTEHCFVDQNMPSTVRYWAIRRSTWESGRLWVDLQC